MTAAKLLNLAKNAVGDLAVAASEHAALAGRRDDVPEARRLNARARRLSTIATELIELERRVIKELT